LSPLPTLIGRRFTDDMGTSSSLREFCTFLTTGIVISAFALPILLARAPFEAPVVSYDPTLFIFMPFVHRLTERS
jgi:hypothetical protein